MSTLYCIFLRFITWCNGNPHIYELNLLVPDINITVPASEDLGVPLFFQLLI